MAVWIPAGEYEEIRQPNGRFLALVPVGQGCGYEGEFYYPLEQA